MLDLLFINESCSDFGLKKLSKTVAISFVIEIKL